MFIYINIFYFNNIFFLTLIYVYYLKITTIIENIYTKKNKKLIVTIILRNIFPPDNLINKD